MPYLRIYSDAEQKVAEYPIPPIILPKLNTVFPDEGVGDTLAVRLLRYLVNHLRGEARRRLLTARALTDRQTITAGQSQ